MNSRMAQLNGVDSPLFMSSVHCSGTPRYSTLIFSMRVMSALCRAFSLSNSSLRLRRTSESDSCRPLHKPATVYPKSRCYSCVPETKETKTGLTVWMPAEFVVCLQEDDNQKSKHSGEKNFLQVRKSFGKRGSARITFKRNGFFCKAFPFGMSSKYSSPTCVQSLSSVRGVGGRGTGVCKNGTCPKQRVMGWGF